MINFKKNDPITKFIAQHYFAISNSTHTVAEFEEFLSIHEKDPLKLVAIGLCYIQTHPMKARGYLSAYDNLYKLGFDGDSLAIFGSSPLQIQYHPLVVTRLVARYFIARDYSNIFNLIADCPSDTLKSLETNRGFIKNIFELTKITKCYKAYDSLGIISPEIEELKSYTLEKQTSIMKSSQTRAETYLSLIQTEQYSIAEEFSWLAYNAGERSEAFFSAVCQPLKTELDISARVMFFRIEASRAFSKNPSFTAYGARTFLHSSEVSAAYEITCKAIESAAANIEVRHLNIRASIILGIQDHVLLPELANNTTERNFYNLNLHRKFSQAILSGNRSQELHYRNLLQTTGLTPQSPESLINTKTALRKNPSPKVAVCISGQLRGIENSSQSIARLLEEVDGHLFIETWKTQRFNFPTFTRVQRLIGNDLWNILPSEVKMPDGFRKHFPRVTKKLTSPITNTVTQEYIKEHFPSSTIRIEDEELFEEEVLDQAPKLVLRGNLNQAKMFYKIKKCQELIDTYSSDNEVSFDVVIRTRPDLEIALPNLREYIEAAHANPNIVYVSYVTALGYGDQFAIGSKKAMDIYSSVWEKIWSNKKFQYTDLFDSQVSLFAGESLMANHLLYSGVEVRLLKPERSYFTTLLSINAVDISEDLTMDIDECAIRPLLKHFHAKYLEMRATNTTFN